MSSDQISSNPSILSELTALILPFLHSNQTVQTFNVNNSSGALNEIIALDQVVTLKANSPVLILTTIQCAGMSTAGTSTCSVKIGGVALPNLQSYMGTGNGCNIFPIVTTPTTANPTVTVTLTPVDFYEFPNPGTSLITVTVVQM